MDETLAKQDEKLISYLFHDLPQTEAQQLQNQMLIDDDLFEQVEVIEMKLIDRFIRNEMTAEEQERFEKRFLIFQSNKDKTREARILHESLQVLRHELSFVDAREAAQVHHDSKTRGTGLPLFLTPFLVTRQQLVQLSLILVVIVGLVGFYMVVRKPKSLPSDDISKAPPIVTDSPPARVEPTQRPTPSSQATNSSPPTKETHPPTKRETTYAVIQLGNSPKQNMGDASEAAFPRSFLNKPTLRFVFDPKSKNRDYFVTIEIAYRPDRPIVDHQQARRGSDSKFQLDVPSKDFKEGETYRFRVENVNPPFLFVFK